MRIIQTSMSNLEFLFNFETIIKENINPLNYRFIIVKAHGLYDSEKLYLTVKDMKENKLYNIALNDFYITKNPFLSKDTFVNLMKYRVSQSSAENEEGYLVSYKRHILTKISQQLNSIKTNQKNSDKKYTIQEIISAISKTFFIPNLNRHFKGETIESLINFIKFKKFFVLLDSSYYVNNMKRNLRSYKCIEREIEEYIKVVKQETKAILYPSFKARVMLFQKDKQAVDYMTRLNEKIIEKNNEK